MDKLAAIEILKRHNEWRRGNDEITMASPKELGCAIDEVIKQFNGLKTENEELRVLLRYIISRYERHLEIDDEFIEEAKRLTTTEE